MKELTKAEEQLMHILWEKEGGFVKDIIPDFPDPKPAYNTVSTIIRILEKKGFVAHEAFGKTHRYYPLVSRNTYKKSYFKRFLNNYFDNSFQNMVSFFTEEEKLSTREIEEIISILDDNKKDK